MTIRYHPLDEQHRHSEQPERPYMTAALTMEQGELALFLNPCTRSRFHPHSPQPCAQQCGTNPNDHFHKHRFFSVWAMVLHETGLFPQRAVFVTLPAFEL